MSGEMGEVEEAMTVHYETSGQAEAGPAAHAFGSFIRHALQPGSFPPDLMAAGKRALLDCLASTISGANETVVTKLIEVYSNASPGEASIIAHGRRKLPCEIAALINGTMGHATDYDDVSFEMWGHATAPVLPAVLAVCEEKSLSGYEFLRAFVIGLEVEIKLGASVAPDHYMKGWHPTSTIGVFGAAAGAAAAGQPTEDQAAAALCIAASRSAGLRANFASMTKALHIGFAARDGYVSALLARSGFSAQAAALDGAFGFLDVMGTGKNTLSQKVRQLGEPFVLLEPGLAFKYYPSCSDTHIAVDTLIEILSENGISAGDIAQIRCGVTKGVHDNLIFERPRSGLERKFSMHYCLAIAALNKRLGLENFADASPIDDEVRALMGRVEMYVDETIDSSTYCSTAIVEVRTRAESVFVKEGRSAMGHPGRELSDAQLEEKFRGCADGIFDDRRADELIDMIGHIEDLHSVDLLVSALSR